MFNSSSSIGDASGGGGGGSGADSSISETTSLEGKVRVTWLHKTVRTIEMKLTEI